MKTNFLKQTLIALIIGFTGYVNAQKFPLTVGVSSTNPTCENYNDGSVTLTVYGGVQPYTFLWSNGAQSQSIENLSPGFYDVLVRDSNSAISITVEIRNTPNFSIQGTVANTSAFGANDGSIDVQLSGVSGSFNFNWSATNGNYVNNGVLDQVNLHAGTYTLTVTNENGCESSKSFLIEQPNPVLNPHNAITIDFVGHEINVKGLIYPNPSNGTLNFKSMDEVNSVNIYNLEGFLVKTVYNKEGNIDAIDLDKGTYKAMIQTIDGKITTETIIVK
jgi:hypothetical protein